jgi:hypothetical protein
MIWPEGGIQQPDLLQKQVQIAEAAEWRVKRYLVLYALISITEE